MEWAREVAIRHTFARFGLSKHAETFIEDHPLLTGTGGLAAVAAARKFAPGAASDLLGTQVVFHGTRPENVAKIEEQGLKRRAGGKRGGGAHTEQNRKYVEHSKGKIHVALAPRGAGRYANPGGMEGMMGRMPGGTVFHAAIPQSVFDEQFEVDPTMKKAPSAQAYRTSTVDIPAEQMVGQKIKGDPKKYWNRLKVKHHFAAREKDLLAYAAKDPARFAQGVGKTLGTLGLGAGGLAALGAAGATVLGDE